MKKVQSCAPAYRWGSCPISRAERREWALGPSPVLITNREREQLGNASRSPLICDASGASSYVCPVDVRRGRSSYAWLLRQMM
jgi:hypothetical protein